MFVNKLMYFMRVVRTRQFWFLLVLDTFLLVCAYYVAFWLRFAPDIPERYMLTFQQTVFGVVVLQMLSLLAFRWHFNLSRYVSLSDIVKLFKAILVGTVLICFIILMTTGFEGYPRSVYILYGILSLLLLGGSRVLIRYLISGPFSVKQAEQVDTGKSHRVLIVGAGDAGEIILREIRKNRSMSLDAIGFADDDPDKIGRNIHGCSILGSINNLEDIVRHNDIEEVIIAMPSAPGRTIRRIMDQCNKIGLPHRTLPRLGQIINGHIKVSRMRDINIEDLIRREPIRLESEKINEFLRDRRVLVTGAGGSIGSELCRQIARFKPAELVLLDKTENNLFHIETELRQSFPNVSIRAILANITNFKHTHSIFSKTRPHVVFHAAAYKHVPLIEINPWEAIFNNVMGTRNVLQCAHRLKVGCFVMVSTDKAVRPTNVMGATKRVAELLTIAYNKLSSATRFVTVRFGNVVGSDGSVIPLFKKQIARGGPITVTHPEATRYFMTIPEASQLIMQAGCMGKGGEVFILNMGTPVRIVDMAEDLIKLAGLEPNKDINIDFIGLRPGEKLYEELITEGEGIVATYHEKIMVLKGEGVALGPLDEHIEKLIEAANTFESERIRQHLKEIVPEYHTIEESDTSHEKESMGFLKPLSPSEGGVLSFERKLARR